MSTWLPAEHGCVPVGTRCLVLHDRWQGDWYDKNDLFTRQKKARYIVYAATLESDNPDPDHGMEWRFAERSFFQPGISRYVTHYQLFPEALPEDWDAHMWDENGEKIDESRQ